MLTVVHILAIKLYITLLENLNSVLSCFSLTVARGLGSDINMNNLGPVMFS